MSSTKATAGPAVVLVSIGVSGFVLFFARAAYLYPGGTFCHAESHGFDPVANYFCDLTHPLSLGGADNSLSVRAMRAAMFALGVAVVGFFQLDPRRLTRVLGTLAGIAVPFVALFPSSVNAHRHAIVVFVAAVPGLVAAALAAHHARSAGTALRMLAAIAVSLALLTTALYVKILIWPDACDLALPLTQKVAAVFLVAWMVATARRSVSSTA